MLVFLIHKIHHGSLQLGFVSNLASPFSGVSNSAFLYHLELVYSIPYAICPHNDTDRQAVGVEIILGALCVATKKSLKDLHILDAGTQ